jgi:putative ABC transport system permease protein
MSFWRQLAHGAHGLIRRNVREKEIDAEIQHFVEELADTYRERGLSDEDARRAARRECGNLHAAKEQVRSYGWENALRTFLADLRFGARQLLRYPGFTAVGVLTLALGVGASTAIFSAVDPILFKAMPYLHPDRILMIWNNRQGSRSDISLGTYAELSQRSHSFESTAIFEPWQPTMTSRDQPQRLEGQSVGAAFFSVLGVMPAHGRDFRASDEGLNAPRVVIISDRLWRELFDRDPEAIGQSIKLDGDNRTVIGIMPRGFDDVLSSSANLWRPSPYDGSKITSEFNGWAWGNHLRMVGRLRPAVSRDQAAEDLAEIARSPWPQFPRPRWASLEQGLIVDSLQDAIAQTVKPALLAIFGAVMIVLIIASVNVINLLLARSAQRAAEFSVRGALGATRLRVLRQLVTESMLLTFLGGVLGVALAIGGVRAIVALSPPELPRLNAISFDPAAFLFATVLVTLIGLAAGVFPALHICRNDLQTGLRRASRSIAGAHIWTRRILVVSEVSLAFILLVSATLLFRSMQRLIAVDPGFNTSQLLTMQVVTSGHEFDDSPSNSDGSARRQRFFEQALDAVRHVPGVEAAAFTSLLPLSDDPPAIGKYGVQFADQDPNSGYEVFRYAVSPRYFQTMALPLISGRFLDEGDSYSAPQVVVISQSLARRHFGNRNPIGSRLHVGPRNRPWYTVAGVVGNVKQTSLAMDEADAVYLSTQQTWFADDTLSYVIRVRGNAAALVPAVKEAIWSVDKNQPIVRVMTMDHLLAISDAQRRFILILFEAFGITALMLAAIGLYSVISGSVTERIHEIGIRMALGASRSNILLSALGDGMRLTGFGMGLGACGAFVAGRAISSLLFGTSVLDPVSWLGMSALLIVVAVLACWIPAWRGTKVDPVALLRSD